MNSAPVQEVWDAMYERVGEDLRGVTRYEPTDFTTKMREDVREQYSPGEDQAIVDQTIVNQIGFKELEQRHKIGRLRAAILTFDESWLIVWPDGIPSKSGFIVSIQRTGDVATIADVDYCIEFLNDRFASE